MRNFVWNYSLVPKVDWFSKSLVLCQNLKKLVADMSNTKDRPFVSPGHLEWIRKVLLS